MRKENGQTQGRKRRRSTCGRVFDAVEGATADREELEHTRVSELASFSSESDERQELVIEATAEMRPGNVLLVDKACETTLNIVNVLNDAKMTEHRLKMKIKRQQDALQKLEEVNDIMRQQLQDYDESKEMQNFVELLKSADEGDKKLFSSSTKSAISAARSLNMMKYYYESVCFGRHVQVKATST